MPIGAAPPTAEAVLVMWAGILPAAPGPGDDFFDAGGQSLHLVQFLQQVYQRYGVDLEVTELFTEELTASRAADVIAHAMAATADVDDLVTRLADVPEDEALAIIADQAAEG